MATKRMTAVFLECGCHDIIAGEVERGAEFECDEHGFQEASDVHRLTVQIRAREAS